MVFWKDSKYESDLPFPSNVPRHISVLGLEIGLLGGCGRGRDETGSRCIFSLLTTWPIKLSHIAQGF